MGRLARVLAPGIAAAAMAACAGTRVALPYVDGAPLQLVVVGDAILPPATDGAARRPDVGGISGSYYDARQDRLYAVSDDRERPRLMTLDVQVGPPVQLRLRDVVPLQLPHLGRRTLDVEGIAPAARGRLYISSEGNAADPREPAPGIYEYTRQGRFVRSLPLPRRYLGSGDGTGMRDNGAFEGLSVAPGGRRLFAATESSLRQDGPETSFERGALTRLLVYDLPVRAAPREYAYRVDPAARPAGFDDAVVESGVAEILALSDRELLFLERSYVRQVEGGRSANVIRIYHVALERAAEVTGQTSLGEGSPVVPLKKTLVFDGAASATELSERLRGLENFEAMSFGPRLPNGQLSVLLISDDNFSPRQVTALIMLALRQLQRPSTNFQLPNGHGGGVRAEAGPARRR